MKRHMLRLVTIAALAAPLGALAATELVGNRFVQNRETEHVHRAGAQTENTHEHQRRVSSLSSSTPLVVKAVSIPARVAL